MAMAAHDPASLSLSSGLDHPVDGNLVDGNLALDLLAQCLPGDPPGRAPSWRVACAS